MLNKYFMYLYVPMCVFTQYYTKYNKIFNIILMLCGNIIVILYGILLVKYVYIYIKYILFQND